MHRNPYRPTVEGLEDRTVPALVQLASIAAQVGFGRQLLAQVKVQTVLSTPGALQNLAQFLASDQSLAQRGVLLAVDVQRSLQARKQQLLQGLENNQQQRLAVLQQQQTSLLTQFRQDSQEGDLAGQARDLAQLQHVNAAIAATVGQTFGAKVAVQNTFGTLAGQVAAAKVGLQAVVAQDQAISNKIQAVNTFFQNLGSRFPTGSAFSPGSATRP